MAKKKNEILIGTALQIVFEYPDWTDEHVSEMYATFKETGDRVNFSSTDLMDMATKADKLKAEGMSWDEAEKSLKSA